MSERPRTLVFGYSAVGYACLELLIARGVNIIGVFTHKDDPGERQWFRSVAELAEQHKIPVFRPASLKHDPAIERQIHGQLKPELIFSFYYRHLIPMKLLELARLGAFNMHGSLLPRYRGKAPVNWAILNGEDHTGATLHHMVAKPDAGDIVDQQRVSIGPRETAGDVTTKVVEASTDVLGRQIDALQRGTAPRRPQDQSQASYFGGRKPDDGRINWNWSSARIFNLVRAVTRPFPGAFADMPDGRRLTVWWAELRPQKGLVGTLLSTDPYVIATADGALQITDFEWGPTPAAATPNPTSQARMATR